MNFLKHTGEFTLFAFRVLLAIPAAFIHPRELLSQLYQIFLGALPLGITAGVAIGVVVWMHLHSALAGVVGSSANEMIPSVLALAVVLEFAPLGAGLIVAGRSGAGLGAELASMLLTEQIDALEVLGLSPLRHLVAPRVLACMITMPLLTVFITYLAIGSGYLAEWLGGNMSWNLYRGIILKSLTLGDAVPATLKTVVFGYLIGVTGCYFGMTAQGGTEGVGRAATRGVVVALFLVLASNVFLVRLIQVMK